ncbi:MAG: 4-(cytidine 5'-diphospho)-2-C-methyl-D-erythritol kinase, partial [Propionibacteriaceae bacterium]|nr:4-(cytidine 5'-diphospho)-2-C-methyl-D-erythritol kinase [Propionibacteriaceae bacterium]
MSLAATVEVSPVIRVRVPAKINLALCVGAERADGYHELATIFQAVSLYDIVTATGIETGITCTVNGPQAHLVGPPHQNLAYRAAALLKQEYAVRAGVALSIDKKIPVAGGMAGGSANGAGALLACARLWELAITQDDLLGLAAQLGADVPFALMGGCAVGLGRGDRLTPTLARGQYHWVLALAPGEMSTPEVFARFDQLAQTSGQ